MATNSGISTHHDEGRHRRRSSATSWGAWIRAALLLFVAAAQNALAQTAASGLAADVRLRVPGSSRFAADIVGRDTVRQHLASMGLDLERLQQSTPAFALAPDESGWLVSVAPPRGTTPSVTMLLAATRDSHSELVTIELFIDDDARLTRLAPREDGVRRTSLAAQRNLRHVHALHGTGGHTRFLAANGARVLAILSDPLGGHAPQLVQYRFDAAGRVSSLRSAPPLATPCCSSSGSNAIFAFTITPLW